MAGRSIRSFTVLPRLPDRLRPLQALAYNLWWCWNADAVALFRRVNPDLFEALDHSPIRLLGATDQSRFEELEHDDGFLAHMDRVARALDHYLKAPTWYQEHHAGDKARIAYFSAEFGIHESVPVYSGGLGVLAGDHLKSASDLGLPLTGITLMYREGYFRQYLNVDGWQQERYPENDFFTLPLTPELDSTGAPLTVTVPLPGREVALRVWHIQVGRVPLYLLDANIPQNKPEDRAITAQLYGGDQHTRIQQEIILGIGGIRALRAMNKMPTVCHMNEGHAAFTGLERIRLLIEEEGLDFATAYEAVKAGTCFTTHTPVPAGNDSFPIHMAEQYLGEYAAKMGLDRNALVALGRQHPGNEQEPFGMTVLALKVANVSNGVSKLHGSVSRRMWKELWPELPAGEVPITSITNGVHTQSWLAPEFAQLYDRYLGIQWEERPTDFAIWKRVEHIPDGELWRTHERGRERLVALARARLRAQLKRRGSPPSEVEGADEVLDPDALTIGFARRFATYKRGDLIFRNAERIAALVNSKDRPVQFIFAGKAHPQDRGGKELIQRVVQQSRKPEFRKRVVFIEDYDMSVARYLVQGVDVWLNNPRRPLEASGTSGMKICGNGGLNLSILDGWWVEGYDGDNGWAIGAGEEYTDLAYQDEVESRALLDLIEQDIAPTFYKRDAGGLPREWIRRMKRSIMSLVPVFNTNRMVEQYTERCYVPSHRRAAKLSANHLQGAKELAAWRRRVGSEWGQVRIEAVDAPTGEALRVGATFPVKVRVNLGTLRPDDVEVQLCYGVLDALGDIADPKSLPLESNGSGGGASVLFAGEVPCRASGQFGFGVRVLPKNANLPHLFEPGMVTWG
ncbi:Glycogen phosphorylase [Gemmata sp. SH-PL17]|uniref:alpha-glucan family phosphorylase n=1 Tax=Gemmata sp. SH-PL17 TaxID=1630693 RepID=UPI00078BAB95|nr:alpha-glucan family phosphorylase [Gemmata sp. SH-PL17]AMV25675.1 Glycogen phosphorylase [Gemmata sp. SH-PL17]